MSTGSSLSNLFDLNSQKGIMTLLLSVRNSNLNVADKNELRDLIFLYTNGGRDQSVKNSLEKKLVTHQITPVEIKLETKPVAALILPFGSSRPAPVFNVPIVSRVASTPLPKAFIKTGPTLPPLATTKVTAAQLPKNKIFAEAPVAVEENTTASLASPAPETSIIHNPVMTEDVSKYLSRIREIKSIVNQRVGNPVNLVDIDNKVGREYMITLLEAMKSLSGGPPGIAKQSMSRLEIAFKAVQLAIESHAKNALVAEQEDSPNEIVILPKTEASPLVKPPIINDTSGIDKSIPPLTPVTESKSVLSSIPAPVQEVATVTEINTSWSKTANSAQPVSKENEPALVNNFRATSIFDDTKLKTPADLPEKKLNPLADQNPLYSNEIDQGLEQLLSDWGLFKKSGLFGTGPRGREHPLFKKIADLQIPLLVSGRFEGATQEIRQTITDYMNGWRYEQGIIYEKGETFEQYLRRVIKHILDLQKKRLPS